MVCPSCITCTTSSLTNLCDFPSYALLCRKQKGPLPGTFPVYRLEACDVLCLKALRALLYFELHRLTLIERLVAVHHDRGKVYKNVFPGLALDEPVALRSIEPLNCSLFLHR